MTFQDEENARVAARMRREREFAEEHRFALPSGFTVRPLRPGYTSPARCNCGCQGADAVPSAPYPDSLGVPPESGQPAAVLLAHLLARRDADPLTREEEARAQVADRVAQAGIDAGTTPLGGREAVRQLALRDADGANLAGSHALALIRQLGIAAVGHEPGVAL